MLNKIDEEKYNFALFCLSFVAIYLIHIQNLYIFFGHNSLAAHFVDWEFVKGFAKCAIENKNRFFDNSCDILSRDPVYPPSWLYTPQIIYFIKNEFIFFISILFLLVSIFKFVKIDNLNKFLLLFLIIISPYFLYAYQRLNVDLIILPVVFFISFNLEKKGLLKKTLKYFGIVFISILKIYPGILYLFFLREKKFYQLFFYILTAVLILLFLFKHHSEILVMLGNKEMAGLPGYGSFSGNNFFYFLSNLFGMNVSPFSTIFLFFNLIIVVTTLIFIRENKISKLNLDTNKINFFISGFLILIFCFVVGYNIIYRLIFILLLIPLLIDNEFVKLKKNKILSFMFIVCFFLKAHTITLFLNLFILDHLNIFKLDIALSTPQEPLPYYDLWDGFLQWIMMIILLVLFKTNGFHNHLISRINAIK